MQRWQDLFLTPTEKEKFCNWDQPKTYSSFASYILQPLWNFFVTLVPDQVSPNILSLGGLLCLVQAWYLCYMYLDILPRVISFAALLLVFAAHTLTALEEKHAKNIHNDSPLGLLFSHCCETIGSIFSALVMCAVLDIDDLPTQWYVVQIGQLLTLSAHTRALKTKAITYPPFMGPGEIIFTFFVLFGLRATVGLSYFVDIGHSILTSIVNVLNVFGLDQDPTNYSQLLYMTVRSIFYFLVTYVLFQAQTYFSKTNSVTRNGLFFCMLYHTIPTVIMWIGIPSRSLTTPLDILGSGLYVSMITLDIIVCKMAKRDLHPWIVIFAMLSLLSNFFVILTVVFYIIALFYEISEYMQLSMFAVTRNVYVDGVYDMCHLGHFNSFKNALSYGTRLFVGVLSDKDVKSYKRKPVMTMEERASVVATSKYVHKVIAPAPFPGIPEEFIRKHRIHVVCLSPEYDIETDKYYKVPRELGIAVVTPRTEGMSTSELIRRAKIYEDKKEQNEEKKEDNKKDEKEEKKDEKKEGKSDEKKEKKDEKKEEKPDEKK